jgi:CO/xanthine dehydrogenase Mo-binding subunit
MQTDAYYRHGWLSNGRRLLGGIAEILVSPATGLVRVTNFTIGAECGKIINPRQLDRCMEGRCRHGHR